MAQGNGITGTEDMKGKEVEVDGYFGKEKHYILPVPENPPTIADKWGREWLYIGEIDEDFIRVAKADKNGLVDISSLGPMRRDYFPCFGE